MAANFDKYLDVAVESVETPQAPPIGHWFASIQGVKFGERSYEKGSDEKTPVIEFQMKLDSPDEDVDADEVAADEKGFAGRMVTKDYRLDDGTGLAFLRKVAEDYLDLDVKGLSIRDLIPLVKGGQVKIYHEHRMGTGDNEGRAFSKVSKILKAE